MTNEQCMALIMAVQDAVAMGYGGRFAPLKSQQAEKWLENLWTTAAYIMHKAGAEDLLKVMPTELVEGTAAEGPSTFRELAASYALMDKRLAEMQTENNRMIGRIKALLAVPLSAEDSPDACPTPSK